VVPILVFWFGVGWLPPVLTAFLISFFPIVVNVATGISTIEPEVEDVLRALGASKRDIILKVGVPRAMPYFFGSLKVAITLAYVGSVIGEQNASNVGIGNLLTRASAGFLVELVWAALVVLAVLGVVMYAMTVMAERRMTGWAQRSNFAGLTAVAGAWRRGGASAKPGTHEVVPPKMLPRSATTTGSSPRSAGNPGALQHRLSIVCDRWAAVEPERVAVLDVGPDGQVASLTYGKMREASNRLAKRARVAGRRRGRPGGDPAAAGRDGADRPCGRYKMGAVALPLAALFGVDCARLPACATRALRR
jgi:hypothetical protein